MARRRPLPRFHRRAREPNLMRMIQSRALVALALSATCASAAVIGYSVAAQSITAERIAALPRAQQAAWEPDFDAPWHIREAAIYALEKGKTHYTSNLGLLELRRAIAAYVERNYSLGYRPDDEILVTVGVSEAIDLALRALLNPGDKVLYHQPCYVSYHPGVALAHGVAIPVPTRSDDGFALNAADLEAAWQPGCKVLMMNFPCNPTGGTSDPARLEKIARFAVEKDLIVLSDEIYSELVYENPHTSIAVFPGMRERTIFLHGFSKAFAMTGFRIGYACGPSQLVDAMMKVHQYSMLCAPILSQEAALEALIRGEDGE